MNPSFVNNTWRTRTAIALATVGAVAVLLGAIVYANTTSAGASRATPNQLSAIMGHFALLRHHASGSLPAELATAIAKAPDSYGLRLGGARHASNTDSWLVPGIGWLCIAAHDADGFAMSCTNAASAEAGELTLIERSQATGDERIIGACPDGYARVSALGDTHSVLGGATVSESTYSMKVQNARQMTLE